MEIESFLQIPLCGFGVTFESGWSKELVLALSTRGHRRNFVAEPLDSLELGHDCYHSFALRLAPIRLPAFTSKAAEFAVRRVVSVFLPGVGRFRG
jgi:hypothetical protein